MPQCIGDRCGSLRVHHMARIGHDGPQPHIEVSVKDVRRRQEALVSFADYHRRRNGYLRESIHHHCVDMHGYGLLPRWKVSFGRHLFYRIVPLLSTVDATKTRPRRDQAQTRNTFGILDRKRERQIPAQRMPNKDARPEFLVVGDLSQIIEHDVSAVLAGGRSFALAVASQVNGDTSKLRLQVVDDAVPDRGVVEPAMDEHHCRAFAAVAGVDQGIVCHGLRPYSRCGRRSRVGDVPTTLDHEDLVGLHCEMIKARVASDRLWSLQRQGQIGTIAPIDGQEATTVGATWALDPSLDWVLPQYREPMALGRYGPEVLNHFAAWALGHPAGGHIPDPIRVFPPQISLATQILHAVGLAWAMKLRREPGVVLVFFGDGSTSEGDFYEAGNLAGVLQVPVIFLCSNNQWAISTPTSSQTAAAGFASKAEGFGIPGVTVDGMDPVAVHEVVEAARERALAGHGATLIEAVNYRLGAHTTADDPTRYVPADELAAAKERDPLVTFRRQLEDRGLWDRDMQADAEQAGARAIDEAWAWASNLPLRQTDLFDHVFATPTGRQQQQRQKLEDHLRGDQ